MASIKDSDGNIIVCPNEKCRGINLVKMDNSDVKFKCQNRRCLREFYLPGLDPSTLDGKIRIDVLQR